MKSCRNCQKQLTNPRSFYCSNFCQHDLAYKEFIREWLAGNVSRSSKYGLIPRYIKRYLMEKHHGQCPDCGWSKINPITRKVPLTVDHRDGDSSNNAPGNVRLLCPNCHSLTETYGYLNKRSSRTYRIAQVQREPRK